MQLASSFVRTSLFALCSCILVSHRRIRVCHSLSSLAQVYAPVDPEDPDLHFEDAAEAFHRTVYLFACTKTACIDKPGGYVPHVHA